MEVLGTAVGVASLGIQVCQGLLTYYNTWKTYDSDISDTYNSVADLSSTLTILQTALHDDTLDEERSDRVETCLQSCVLSLMALSTEAQKLRKTAQPVGPKQKIVWAAQRLQYPFQAKTLARLRASVSEMQGHLQIALQVLQLESTQQARKVLASLEQSGQEQKKILIGLEQSGQEQKAVLVSLEQSGLEQKRVLKSVEKSGQAQETVLLSLEQRDQQQRLKEWLHPADPSTNHASARQLHQSGTGDWLLQSTDYQHWKSGLIKHIWLYGKAGCGKTILFSTLIEDIQTHCANKDDSCLGMFYFTFTDQKKQTYDDLLRSLIIQLGMNDEGLAVLQRYYNRSNGRQPIQTALEEMVVICAQSYSTVYVMLDALDECPEENDARYQMLQGLEGLEQRIPQLKFCVTSRDISIIRNRLTATAIAATQLSLQTAAVNADIRQYLSHQLLSDGRLTKLNQDIKALIMEKLSDRADGM
jgi:hypothetical protein